MLPLVFLSAISAGLLQLFGYAPIHDVKVTGYCPGPPCVVERWADGITAAGTEVSHGVCAADWRVYPKGSVFHIKGYGRCRVEDTGNAVKGRHLDLYFPTAQEARHWGVQVMTVYYVGREDLS